MRTRPWEKHETKKDKVINDYYDFITHEESEKRLILIGSIFALCLLTLATAFGPHFLC